jgi:flagellar protein FliO/FliZ
LIGDYLLRLAIMLPIICGMIVGALYLAKKFNLNGLRAGAANNRQIARVAESSFLSPGVRLAVIDFADRRLLVSVSKQGITKLSETGLQPFTLGGEQADA